MKKDGIELADQPEIVRCEDCMYWGNGENKKRGYCLAEQYLQETPAWDINIYRKTNHDFFCGSAERKKVIV